jgi:hypothetical protein
MSAVTDLASQQRALQRLITSGTDLADGGERVGIYASAYRLRLIEALGANYPMLQTHLGLEPFANVALEYLDDHPSTYVSIRTFGLHLPSWLKRTHAREPWLAEFAALEWALGCAFDAPDSTTIGRDALANIRADDWAALAFRFSAALSRLSFATNAAAQYEAAASAQTPPPDGRVSDKTEWLVWRRVLQAQYRSLAVDEAIAIDTLLAGGTFADACERLAELGDEDSVPLRAAAFLKRWLLDELVMELRIESVP